MRSLFESVLGCNGMCARDFAGLELHYSDIVRCHIVVWTNNQCGREEQSLLLEESRTQRPTNISDMRYVAVQCRHNFNNGVLKPIARSDGAKTRNTLDNQGGSMVRCVRCLETNVKNVAFMKEQQNVPVLAMFVHSLFCFLFPRLWNLLKCHK